MKKNIIVLLMLCCSTLILSSCGGTHNTNGGGGQVEQPKSPNFQIQLSKNHVTLMVGDKQNLSAIVKDKNSTGQYYSGPIYWQSSNDDIATVDSNGQIKAVSKGHCTITVSITTGDTATCSVEVTRDGSFNIIKEFNKSNYTAAGGGNYNYHFNDLIIYYSDGTSAYADGEDITFEYKIYAGSDTFTAAIAFDKDSNYELKYKNSYVAIRINDDLEVYYTKEISKSFNKGSAITLKSDENPTYAHKIYIDQLASDCFHNLFTQGNMFFDKFDFGFTFKDLGYINY